MGRAQAFLVAAASVSRRAHPRGCTRRSSSATRAWSISRASCSCPSATAATGVTRDTSGSREC